MAPRAMLSWSSGKDAAMALIEARRLGLADVVAVLTTVNESYGRVAMHGVREELLDLQAAALGLDMVKVRIPAQCSNETYNLRMAEACAAAKARGITHVVFGDLFLEDIRAYREARLEEAGLTGIFPLWGRETARLAEEMIEAGIAAHLVCIDPSKLDRSFAGRRFDRALIADLPAGVDPCGENGEFHTLVSGGPMFSAPIDVTVGEVVEREGFIFTDVRAERLMEIAG